MAATTNSQFAAALSGTKILSREPPIIYTVPLPDLPLGFASFLGGRHPELAATVLLQLWWTHEDNWYRARLLREAALHHQRAPRQTLVVLCNTEREVELLATAGVPALLANHNIMVSEKLFRPLSDVTPEFDAVYNARLNAWKRHELAADIPRAAYICYQAQTVDPQRDAEAAKILQMLLARAPQHSVINPIADGRPVMISPSQVNEVCNRAAVGLCLSAQEGAMFSSMEYMLAGLAIVSTPSIGGRDVFFDSEYCAVVAPDPRAVRDAVVGMRARRIPRDYIRHRTLARIERERLRFLRTLDDILVHSGLEPRFGTEWPFGHQSRLVKWMTCTQHEHELFSTEDAPAPL
jgi:glycosyltransferase involved in cell wall biosynthesis